MERPLHLCGCWGRFFKSLGFICYNFLLLKFNGLEVLLFYTKIIAQNLVYEVGVGLA